MSSRKSDEAADDDNDDEEDDAVKHGDIIKRSIGSMGRHQIVLCLLLCFTTFPIAFQQMSVIFLSPPVNYVCKSTNITNGCPCSDPIYDRSIFEDTIIMKWNLICDQSSLKDLPQTMVMFGILVGSLVVGILSDRYGRRYPFIASLVLQLVAGVACAFAPDIWSFSGFRFVSGLAASGIMVTAFVLLMETVGREYREPLSALFQLPFNVGHLMLAGIAYFFRDPTTLQLVSLTPSVLMLSYYWLVPESPRWLLAVGETDKAIAILKKAAIRNKLPTKKIAREVRIYQIAQRTEETQKGTLLDLFRTPNLRKNTILMTLAWLICGFGFFGVSQYVSKLPGDIFVIVSISAVSTMSGTLSSIYFMHVMKRRTVLCLMFSISAFCLFFIAIINHEIANVIFACVGGAGIFICFISVYLCASEIFPTVVRNAGIGLSSMMSRIGSMVAPYVAGLEETSQWLPSVIFGFGCMIGTSVCIFMPETKGRPFMNTINEGENLGKK